MDVASNFKIIARYNQRMNLQLLSTCRSLSPAQLNRDTRSYFSSIFDMWNHMIVADRLMLQRLADNHIIITEKSLQSLELDEVNWPETDLDNLVGIRESIDHLIVDFSHCLTPEDCQKSLTYVTENAVTVTFTVNEFLLHWGNHQTHHRGQLTCVLSQFGLDYGVTDLPLIVPEAQG
ncbi:damage-inducible protein DinB [Vibrio sp. CAIM 722]|uniref:Damage-inducible protein DinB n=1 Tax=Vibrio eleionomae TaxID=2653505 RepID=A0A7X4RV49_9VIBR|nr:DinB family protein [Vibrio eleionomae]MZI93774.1 damage-inducible protein DinB [Vibrio eleionomae]